MSLTSIGRVLFGIVTPILFAQPRPVYLDPGQPIEKRIEDLLGRMTLEEKVGQMNMPCVYRPELGSDSRRGDLLKSIPEKTEICKRFAVGEYIPGLGPAGGFFTMADNILVNGPRQQAEFFNELQRMMVEKTRLRIPLLQSEEGTHGLMCTGGTIFPEGPAIGSTWNMDLVQQIYAAAALEARAVGIHQLYTLVIEPNRDPRMGRNEEGFSEDPYLCSRIAESIVRGAQGWDVSAPDKVVAGLCHYPGQSEPVSGSERGAMEISERMLREVFLPPWFAGIKRMGALGVMATYPAIDSVPTHGSEKILTKILREEMGFRGLVLGEGLGLSTLLDERVASDQKDAGAQAILAGVDVGISMEKAYQSALIENVKEGRVPMALVNRAVRRILRQKFALGLFERPYVDVGRAANGIPRNQHRDLALEVARQGIVLLKNESSVLPLRKNLKTIAVIGPDADAARNQLGDYTSKIILQEIITVLQGVRNKVSPSTEIVYVKGCDNAGDKLNEIQAAQAAAKRAEAAVVVLGESSAMDGEGRDVVSLDLPGLQEDLVKAVRATGTPTVVVLINGRTLSTRWVSEHVPAIIEAWLPGERGGQAVADVIFGDVNPSGRLPLTVPRHVGQLPTYYSVKPTKVRRRYVDMPASPLYPFGYGLSYTRFDYSGLEVAPASIRPGGEVRVSVAVRNAGARSGQEVVQMYLNDAIASVSRPVLELRGFRKVSLAPGESKRVEFTITPEDLTFLDRDLKPVVEPGTFNVLVGASSADIRLRGSFEVLR